ncbi:MAG: galactose-1-phosphate uridylyltransferase, partial [Gemmatimonadaceae bacterium]
MVWEQRWHPLRREWVVITSHRDNRPWHGERVGAANGHAPLADYVADCYLCPGNERISGERNTAYAGVFTFDNDHPCVSPGAPAALDAPPGIYRSRPATGLS